MRVPDNRRDIRSEGLPGMARSHPVSRLEGRNHTTAL